MGELNFCSKTFYWCSSSNYNFASMPAVSAKLASTLAGFNGLFTGEHDKVLQEAGAGEGQETYVFENDTLVVTNKGKNITELDRLAYVVNQIETQCHLVPEGSVKLTPLHEIRRNEAFTGLNKEDATNLSKYMHFRKVDQMERFDSVFKHDFLDVIDKDPIKGSWTLHLDTTESVANIRNLIWPGFFAYHKIGTTLHGSFYFGDGRMNSDLAFML